MLTGDIAEVPPEGSLLPETYKFTRGDTRQDILDRMRRERDRVLADVWSRRAPDLPVKTPAELVTLASIVEKETALADERSRVAAVFINRLKLNMRLQSDPTVIYGMFGGAGKPADFTLARKDLETPTPYNTYVVAGLPHGPIANPGRASLEAVANPSRTRDLYLRRRRQRRPRLRRELRGAPAQRRPLARRQRQHRCAADAAAGEAGARAATGDAAPATPPTRRDRLAPRRPPTPKPARQSADAAPPLNRRPRAAHMRLWRASSAEPILAGTGRRCRFAA